MITTAQRKKLKKVFKTRYSTVVLARLKQKGILTKKGKSFGISYISHVFNGRNEDLLIEETIIELYQEKVAEEKAITQRRKEIFEA
ncbi:hypothetical protein ACNQF7_10335 [Flavobacterium sp. RSP29]|uniref:hypothetical protein n=1 Tax=Flavobacterium sp. RSP29 TaxID=3401731 RepID=UPI003AABC887